MLKAVIFDVDGTLVDTNDLHVRAWVDTFQHFGVEGPFDDLRQHLGKGADQLMPVFVSRDVLQEKAREIEAFRSEIYAMGYLPQACGFRDVRPLLARIRADGKKVALASSGKRAEIQRYMEVTGIEDLVDAVTTSEEAEYSKPAPDIFEAALDALTPLRPEQALVVGDTPYDAEAARKAGMRAVGVLCGGFDEAELRKAGCVAVYRDPAHLLREYERSPLAHMLAA